MVNVLMVAGILPPRRHVLAQALEQFRDKGATVHIACFFDAGQMGLDDGAAQLRSLPDIAASQPPGFRRAVERADVTRKVWLHARRDPWVRQRARSADVLVALDPGAIHTVWQLAQRNRAADAIYGLTASLRAVQARAADPARYARRRAMRPGPSPMLPLRTARRGIVDGARMFVRRAFGPRLMRVGLVQAFWRLAVSAPGLPDRLRIKLVERVHTGMTAADQRAAAARVLDGAGRRLRPRPKAGLLRRLATAELARGRVPDSLLAAVRAELALADAALDLGDAARAGTSLARVVPLLFSRVAHFDSPTSPLAEDPAGFLAPLHSSAVGRALASPRGRSAAAAPKPAGRPLRLLFVHHGNDNFLAEIRDRYESLPDTEVRLLDLGADPMREPLTRRNPQLFEHLLTGTSGYGRTVEEWLGPHVRWADTVFVDWCVVSAAMITMIDPGDTRIIIRLHSFEAWKIWPQVVDYSRVDDMVFVSEHLRDLTLSAVPRLLADGAPRLHVISNAMDLRRYPRQKAADARFNLGMVGIGTIAKDPRWAVRVLRVLRQRDPRYRLLLIGSDFDAKDGAAAKRYSKHFHAEIIDLEEAGAVRRLGQVDDVPAALADVGVIVSSSLRESFHCGLVEGVASGAVPVVRDWPFFAGRPHGAHTLFPEDWVVDTPEQAAERILKLTATEDGWREAGRVASAHALAAWDWTVTSGDFDRLLLGADRG
jgi:glycosyltransferase involved in cell wall biosynthesis